MLQIDTQAARRFLLDWQGLRGQRRFTGRRGAVAFVRQAGCIQFDPLDTCGRNPELVLAARVAGFTPQVLDTALYQTRELVDYWDKNMAIFCMADWPHFARTRERFRLQPWQRSREHIEPVLAELCQHFETRGALFANNVDFGKKVDWAWSPTTLARAAMETLYFEGRLVVHHRKGTVRAFDLAERHVPPALWDAPDPFADAAAFTAWRVARRIGAVGMLWNRPSDAFLGIDMKAEQRQAAFAALEQAGRIVPVQVAGSDEPLYILAEAEARLAQAVTARAVRQKPPRTEFLAPLDNLMWDRRLIEALFGFYYRWEVYTPAGQRQYGYYVLPVLQGDALVGRIEPVRDRRRKLLQIKGAWWEQPVDLPGVREALNRHAAMLGLSGWEGDIGEGQEAVRL